MPKIRKGGDSDGREKAEAYGAEEDGRQFGKKLNAKEPLSAKGIPDCPKWLLPEAMEKWKRLCQKLSDMGVLTEI